MEQRSLLLLLVAFTVAAGEASPMGASAAEDFDTILTHIGIGKWNVIHYAIIAYWKATLPYHTFAGAFISPFVKHTCRPPTHPLAETIVLSNNVTTATQNVTTNTTGLSLPHDASCKYLKEDKATGRLEEMPCTEWDFDNSTFSSTVTSEYGLVCERQYLRVLYQSIYMGGNLVGSFFSGYLAYRFGRLTMITISTIAYTVMALGSAWIPSLGLLLVFRFLLGSMHSTSLVIGYILVTEITKIRWRAAAQVTTACAWPVGTMLWGLFAYLERDWRWLQTYVSLFCPIMIPFLFFLDESPRWLVVMGHHNKALSVLQRAARMNGTSLPPTDHLLAIMKNVQQQSTSAHEKNKSQPTNSVARALLRQVTLLLSTRKLVTATSATCIGFFAVSTIFFGIALSAPALNINDPFTFMAISGLVELPAVTGFIMMERFGRKKFGISVFALCAACLLIQPLVPESLKWMSITLVMVGKLSSTSAFDVMFLYSSELFPTEVRTQGMSVAMMSSRIGAFISPFIMAALEIHHPWAISVVFGLTAAVAAVSFLPLWETAKTCLPDTIAQLEAQKEASTPDDHTST